MERLYTWWSGVRSGQWPVHCTLHNKGWVRPDACAALSPILRDSNRLEDPDGHLTLVHVTAFTEDSTGTLSVKSVDICPSGQHTPGSGSVDGVGQFEYSAGGQHRRPESHSHCQSISAELLVPQLPLSQVSEYDRPNESMFPLSPILVFHICFWLNVAT